MAKMYVDGIDNIQNALHTTEDGIADFVDDLLAAGGEIAKKKIEESITRHHHVRTGELLRSIKITKGKDKDGQKIQRSQSYWKKRKKLEGHRKQLYCICPELRAVKLPRHTFLDGSGRTSPQRV